MKHIKLFEGFLSEAKGIKIEAAEASNKFILFSMNGKFFGKLSFSDIYYQEKDQERNKEIKELLLKSFPASESWKKECEQYKDSKVDGLRHNEIAEEVLLAANKERNGGGQIGQIQLWDESKLTHSISISGPFQDSKHSVSGKYVGGIYFSPETTKTEILKITKVFKEIFPGGKKTKTWIEGN